MSLFLLFISQRILGMMWLSEILCWHFTVFCFWAVNSFFFKIITVIVSFCPGDDVNHRVDCQTMRTNQLTVTPYGWRTSTHIEFRVRLWRENYMNFSRSQIVNKVKQGVWLNFFSGMRAHVLPCCLYFVGLIDSNTHIFMNRKMPRKTHKIVLSMDRGDSLGSIFYERDSCE